MRATEEHWQIPATPSVDAVCCFLFRLPLSVGKDLNKTVVSCGVDGSGPRGRTSVVFLCCSCCCCSKLLMMLQSPLMLPLPLSAPAAEPKTLLSANI